MDEEIVPVCSPRLIEKYFPDAVMINENTYDLSPEDLLKSPATTNHSAKHLARMVSHSSHAAP